MRATKGRRSRSHPWSWSFALFCTVLSLLLTYWLVPDIIEGIQSRSWPMTRGQLLSVGKGVWAEGGELPVSRSGKGTLMGRYSGGYYGVSVRYHYLAPGPEGEKTPYTGWRYDVASSSRAFLALPGMAFPQPDWAGVHPGAPFTYAGIAHAVQERASALKVYYDPTDPERAVLNPGIATDTAFLLILLCTSTILSFRLWLPVINPRRDDGAGFQGTTLTTRTILFALIGLLYVVFSLPMAVFFHRVIPSRLLLACTALGLLWIFFPRLFQPFFDFAPIRAVLNRVVGRIIVILCVAIALYGQLAGLFGWKIYGEIVPSYRPDKETVLAVLADADPYLYPWALYELTENGLEPAHLPIIIDMLGREVEGSIRVALYALNNLGPSAGDALPVLIELLPDYPEAVYTVREIEPAPVDAIPALVGLLGNERWDIRTTAMDLLGGCGSKAWAAVPELEHALADPEFRVRMGALGALGRIGATGSVRRIADKLDDEQAEVRQRAAEALKRIGPEAKSAAPALEERLNDEDEWVRKEAAEALKWIRR